MKVGCTEGESSSLDVPRCSNTHFKHSPARTSSSIVEQKVQVSLPICKGSMSGHLSRADGDEL